MGIKAEIQSLAPTAQLEFFILDMSSAGGGTAFFHAGTNGLQQPIVWQGQQYLPLPIEAEGFDVIARGALPRPKMRVANIDGLFSAEVRQRDDLVGCKVTRKRTFARYLDAVNFPQRRNLLLRSGEFTSTSWGKTRCTVNLAASTYTPSGRLAYELKNDGVVNSTGYVFQTVTWDGNNRCASVMAKAGVIKSIQLDLIDSGGFVAGARTAINLETGQVTSSTPFTTATNMGQGWWRISCAAPPLSGSGSVRISLPADATAGTAGLFIADAQLEAGVDASDYQPIGASWSANPDADPSQHMADDIWFVDRKVSENRYIIEFELASAFDLQGNKLPARQVIQNSCPWRYRGPECGWTGGYYDKNDQPCGVLDDLCAKRLTSCRVRFTSGIVPFGGFPGSVRYD